MCLCGLDMMFGNEENFGNGWRFLMFGKVGILWSLLGWIWIDDWIFWCLLFIEWLCLCLCWVGLGVFLGEWIGLFGKFLLCNILLIFDLWNDEGILIKILDLFFLILKRGRWLCFVVFVVIKGLMILLFCFLLLVGVNLVVCVDVVVIGVVDKLFIIWIFLMNFFFLYIVFVVFFGMLMKFMMGFGGGVDGYIWGL